MNFYNHARLCTAGSVDTRSIVEFRSPYERLRSVKALCIAQTIGNDTPIMQ